MIFTPEQSSASLARIVAETGLEFTDSTYSNDMCDSIDVDLNGQYVSVGLPTIFGREPEDEEEFNTFTLTASNKVSEYDTIEELIIAINALK